MTETPVQFDPHEIVAATWMEKRYISKAVRKHGCIRHEGNTCPLLILEPLILRNKK